MTNTDSWKDFGGKYLKAQNVENNTDKYVVVAVDSEMQNEKTTLILTLEREGSTKLFGCNATNEQAVQAVCPDSPNQAIGRVITFEKERVRNPGTNQMVDGLRIQFNDVQEESSDIDEDNTI